LIDTDLRAEAHASAAEVVGNGCMTHLAVSLGGCGNEPQPPVAWHANRGSNTLWSGLIDDVRIYDSALTAEEIAALAQ